MCRIYNTKHAKNQCHSTTTHFQIDKDGELNYKTHALGGKERRASVWFVLFGFNRRVLDGAYLGK